MASLKRSLEEFQQTSLGLRAQLDSSQLLLTDTETRLEELSLRPSPEAIVETFKKSDTYRDLLIDNTVSIMKEFSSEVYPEYHGIHSLFPKFVEKTFGKEYVVELTDSEEDDTESTDHGDDDAFVEDAPAEDAPATSLTLRDRLFLNTVVEAEEGNTRVVVEDPIEINISQAQIRQMARVRDSIADQIWTSVGH
ncbi:hypothetical protein LIER_31138 [Lithospermum erythrorhizon]|uniref:Uncharacterized protein n=1 Tax=Lithospermum erythrorhizon TaxID=34254 RepID=A0AAV3RTL1_LITER